jgi:hypothetical protein
MFLRLDEKEGDNWSLSRAVLESFAACMIITSLLDFWRLSLGMQRVLSPHSASPTVATLQTTAF